MVNLQGKTALVTGSTSGIGLGIAEALGRAGANIVLNGFGDVDAALATIAATGAQSAHHPADMRKPDEIEAMIAMARERFGAVDVLVNNAGIQHVAQVEDFPAQKWDDILPST
jgi:3-hydroxybutyrate dehydrogenase